jgi:hypothetical protein
LRKFTKEFGTSLITAIAAILAIVIFISSGGDLLFYGVVAFAIAFGFYNAWLISVSERPKKSPTPKRSKSRRRQH